MVTGFERSRVIALFHLETKQMKTLPIPAEQCNTPRWSPDGQKIAFEFLGEDRMWKVGVIDVNGKTFEIVSNKSHWTFLGCWANSGRTIVYYDHTYIYEIDLHHTLVNTIPWSHLEGSVYGGLRFSMSDDQRYLLYHAVVEDEYIEGMTGPVDAIFVYDMETGISKSVSPIGMFASEPHWIPGTSQFIYTGTTRKDVQKIHRITTRIYKDSLDTSDPSLLVDEGEFLSVSMPDSKELKIED
jgi:Tol biopolymer transport system component